MLAPARIQPLSANTVNQITARGERSDPGPYLDGVKPFHWTRSEG